MYAVKNGCKGDAQTTVVATSQLVTEPTLATTAAICSGSVAHLSATAADSIAIWYDSPIGNNVLQTGSQFTTPPINVFPTKYYTRCVD